MGKARREDDAAITAFTQLAHTLVFAHPLRDELEVNGDTHVAVVFVKRFTRAAGTLAKVSTRAERKGYLDSVFTLGADRQQSVLAALLTNFVALHEPRRLGLSKAVLDNSPLLFITGTEYDQLTNNNPDLDPSIIKHFAVGNPSDPDAAIARWLSTGAIPDNESPDIDLTANEFGGDPDFGASDHDTLSY